ncbi:hypothetical protein D3C85_1756620 [compost metagenome]
MTEKGNVFKESLLRNVEAIMNSFQQFKNVVTMTVTRAGIVRGAIIWNTMR